jgi:SAM-dependent methyltransferase
VSDRSEHPDAALTGPNAEQFRYWNGPRGEVWRARRELVDRQVGRLGRLAMDSTGIEPGGRVLDVGCGCGDTLFDLAERVGPLGQVPGIDLSGPMLTEARACVSQAGLSHVKLLQGDAQYEDLGEGAFDRVYSRFGVMFFEDPDAAFGNLHRAVRPKGRLGFVCWQALERNPWMYVPMGCAARIVPPPPRPAPGTPGPFALADPERVHRILTRAGFGVVEMTDWTGDLPIGGGSLQDAVELLLEIGPAAAALRDIHAGPETRNLVSEAFEEALAPYEHPAGLRMPGAAWIVTGSKP